MSALGPRPRDLDVPSESAVKRRVRLATFAVFAAFLAGSVGLFALLAELGAQSLTGAAYVLVLAAYGSAFGYLLWRSSQRELALVRTTSLFLEDLPVGILFVDPEGTVTYANPALVAMTGRSVEEVRGRSAAAFVHPEDRQRIGRELLRRAKGEVSTYELRIAHKDESVLHGMITAIPFFDGYRFDGSLAVVLDMTEILEMRAKAARYQELSAFALDAVTHDLSNRMQEILSRAAIAGALVPGESARAKAAIQAATQAAERATRLIREVKQIAAAERLSWPKRTIEVPALVGQALSIADVPPPMRVEAEVSPEAAAIKVGANDLAPLVLSKLLEHAAEGGRGEGGRLLLKATVESSSAPQLVVRVLGSRRAVSDDDLKLMMAPPREAGAGETPWRSGVKLALASSVAQAHGWGLRASRAKDGKGAVFEVYIPVEGE